MNYRIATGIVCAVLGLALWSVAAEAVTPAGTIIRNQASATYTDNEGVARSTTSNIVETVVRNVAGFELSHDQQKAGAAGTVVAFSHVLTNTGNMPDQYELSASDVTQGDNYDFQWIRIFSDSDQNGLPDSAVPLTTTPLLAAGHSFHFVVEAGIPPSVVQTDQAQLIIEAVSAASVQNANPLSQINNDLVTVAEHAVVVVSKTLSQLRGASPSGPFRVTLAYTNNSSQAVSDVLLIDSLPAGMTYVIDSARWSELPGTVLTDFDTTDLQGSAAASIGWCAYDNSCMGLPVAQTGAGGNAADSINQASALLSSLSAGVSGSVWFDVTIDSGLAPGSLSNTAEYETGNGVASSARQFSNTVVFNVHGYQGVVANGSGVSSLDGVDEPVPMLSAGQGGTASFDNYIWNTGNQVDTFDIEIDELQSTFPTATLFRLYHADGVTPLLDSNGNGTADTGPLSPGMAYQVVLKAILPFDVVGNNQGNGFSITKIARSSREPTLFNPVVDHLQAITAQGVDLTNHHPVGHSQTLGAGQGPESEPLEAHSVLAGAEVEYVLYVNNTGTETDSYVLSVSADAADPLQSLPAQWLVVFVDSDGNAITRTKPLAAGSSQRVVARIRVPSASASTSASQGMYSLFFRAQSLTTLAADVKHDALEIIANLALSLEPDQTGQAIPGTFKVYSHLLSNTGNTVLTDIALSVEDSLASEGWMSALYEDSNSNGQLDAADQLTTTQSLLDAGQSVVLFAKVFVPASASASIVNTTVVKAYEPVQGLSQVARDQTGVTNSAISILKEQALDLGCDQVPDAAYSVGSFQIEPGNNCILYRLTATNNGPDQSFNVVIHDSTPGHTRFQAGASCSLTGCIIETPVTGSTGYIRASVPELQPGNSFSLDFAVMVE